MFVQKQTAKAARVLRPKEKTWVCNIKFWAWGLVFFFFWLVWEWDFAAGMFCEEKFDSEPVAGELSSG